MIAGTPRTPPPPMRHGDVASPFMRPVPRRPARRSTGQPIHTRARPRTRRPWRTGYTPRRVRPWPWRATGNCTSTCPLRTKDRPRRSRWLSAVPQVQARRPQLPQRLVNGPTDGAAGRRSPRNDLDRRRLDDVGRERAGRRDVDPLMQELRDLIGDARHGERPPPPHGPMDGGTMAARAAVREWDRDQGQIQPRPPIARRRPLQHGRRRGTRPPTRTGTPQTSRP